MQASLEPVSMTLDIRIATDISLVGAAHAEVLLRPSPAIVQLSTVLLSISCSFKDHPKLYVAPVT